MSVGAAMWLCVGLSVAVATFEIIMLDRARRRGIRQAREEHERRTRGLP